jgi:uncharacterized protein (DUF2062 family)
MSFIFRYIGQLTKLLNAVKYQVFYSVTPVQTARSVLFGFYLGIFPIIGVTTVLCLIAAYLFKLNYYIVLAVNYLVAPLQLILIVPFIQISHWANGKSETGLTQLTITGAAGTTNDSLLAQSVEYIGEAIACWGTFSLATGYLLYRLLIFVNRTP